jgi:hypothetical protein
MVEIHRIPGAVRALISLVFDRRVWPRLTVHPPVTLILIQEGNFPHPARLINLSQGGAKLSMFTPLNTGTTAALEHAHSRLLKPCTVRFCRRDRHGFGIGLEFHMPLSSADLQSICLILRNEGRFVD